MTPLEPIAVACAVTGAAVFAVGALGLIRLRDFYARLYGVAIAASLGTALLLLSLLLWFPSPVNALKIGLALLVQMSTAAVGGNALARAGYLTGTPVDPGTRHDALAAADPDDPTGED